MLDWAPVSGKMVRQVIRALWNLLPKDKLLFWQALDFSLFPLPAWDSWANSNFLGSIVLKVWEPKERTKVSPLRIFCQDSYSTMPAQHAGSWHLKLWLLAKLPTKPVLSATGQKGPCLAHSFGDSSPSKEETVAVKIPPLMVTETWWRCCSHDRPWYRESKLDTGACVTFNDLPLVTYFYQPGPILNVSRTFKIGPPAGSSKPWVCLRTFQIQTTRASYSITKNCA
jgi:hypothetical protein